MRLGTGLSGATLDHLHTVRRVTPVSGRTSSLGNSGPGVFNEPYHPRDNARSFVFASVTVFDDDLGRSGSGLVERSGFQKLVASVCSGSFGAVFCIEASWLGV